MRKLKLPEVAEKKLELGDYVTVHVPGLNRRQLNSANQNVLQFDRETFIQRVMKQRGKLINLRERSAA
jgi:hypothetical protein